MLSFSGRYWIDLADSVGGHRPFGCTDANVGDEASAARIFDEVQNAREDGVLSLGSSDVDNSGTLELLLEEAVDTVARVFIQPVEGFVNHEPARFVQQNTRKHKALLLVISKFLVPARDAVELGGKTIQACGLEHCDELRSQKARQR
jgi:hypothetical protein